MFTFGTSPRQDVDRNSGVVALVHLTMRAMSYSRYGGPEVLESIDLPTPKVPPGFVLIKVRAIAVNPVDWKIMAGYLDPMMDVHFPAVPGWDVAGVVEAVGPDVRELAVGDEVLAYGRRDEVQHGAAAEYTSVPVRTVARKPAGLSWEQAAALPLAGLTALQVIERLGVGEGDTVLVHGASGGVGQMAVQLATRRGARVIGTASERNHEFLRGLGAEPVTYGDGLVDRVKELAPDGVDAVADLVGGVSAESLAVLKNTERHVSIADNTVEDQGGQWLWLTPDRDQLAELAQLVADGELQIDIASVRPLEELAAAYTESAEGHTRGKLVLSI